MDAIQDLLERMDPEQALSEIARSVKTLLPMVGEEARIKFIMDLTGGAQDDKVSSMVHL
jgi:hypothetical protein